VEKFISAVLSVQEHIDPYLLEQVHKKTEGDLSEAKKKSPSKESYSDLIGLNEVSETETTHKNSASPREEKDIMLYIQDNSAVLENWQRDIMTMLREEMLYFWPQLETKIMNEGWATYWHAKIMREMDLTTEESIEFAKLHANVTQPSQKQLNPYYLGLKLFENIEREERAISKDPDPEKDAMQKLFEIRALDSDQSFIRNYMTKEFVEKEDLFLFHKKDNEYVIHTKDWEAVRDQLVASRVNGGFPYLVVSDGDYLKNGELYLKHRFEETELEISSLEKVLFHLHELWGRTVHLETVVETYNVLFSCDGQKVHRKRMQ
jgi:stage V sporulation protein R